MTSTTFDALAYFEKLKAAGVPEAQAKIQANTLRDYTEAMEAKNREELATKSGLRETELRLQKEIKETELRLQKEIQEVKNSLLKWQFGIAAALAAIMAKGFGWLGF